MQRGHVPTADHEFLDQVEADEAGSTGHEGRPPGTRRHPPHPPHRVRSLKAAPANARLLSM